MDRSMVYGDEQTIFGTPEAARRQAEHLSASGEWGNDKPPTYRVVEAEISDLNPAEMYEAIKNGLVSRRDADQETERRGR